MLEGVLSKLLPTENSVIKILEFDERITELQNEIGILSNIYTERTNLLTKSNDSEYSDKIRINHEMFMDEYLKRVGKLRKELSSITKKRDTLLGLSDIHKAYKDFKKDEFLQSYIDKCRRGEVNQNVLSVLMKSVGNSPVRYSDVICFNPQGKFLIIQRANKEDDKNSKLWGVPGGHVDMGEDHKSAACREFFEETGIKIPIKNFEKLAVYEDDKVYIEYFKTFTEETEPTILLDDNETHDYKWIGLREIEEFDMPFNMRENLQKILLGENFTRDISKAKKDTLKLRKVKKLVTRDGKTFLQTFYVKDDVDTLVSSTESVVSKQVSALGDLGIGDFVSISTKVRSSAGEIVGFIRREKDGHVFVKLRDSEGNTELYNLARIVSAKRRKSKPDSESKSISFDNIELEDLEFVSKLGGSSEVGLYKSSNGEKFVVKKPRGSSTGVFQLREEVLADSIYRVLGFDVPNSKLLKDGSKVSQFIEGKELGIYHRNLDLVKGEIRKGFVADAFLANWDVVGGNMDNIIVESCTDSYCKVYRIDNGGALRVRARGGLKEEDFTYNINNDIISLQEHNPIIFGDMSSAEIIEQGEHILDHSTEILKLVRDYDDSELLEKMTYRLDSLRELVDKLKSNVTTDEDPGIYSSVTTKKYFDDWDDLVIEGNPEIKQTIKNNIIEFERKNQKFYEEEAKRYGMTVEELKSELQKVTEEIAKESNCFIAARAGKLGDSVIDKIFESGRFKSQFESMSSGGAYMPNVRSLTENAYFGFPDDIDKNKELRPIYGYFSTNQNGVINDDGKIPPPHLTSQYGNVSFKIKKDIALKKATISFVDSLGGDGTIVCTPMVKPHFSSLGTASYRILEKAQNMLKNRGTGFDGSYVEAQYHNQLYLDDVESIHFTPYMDGYNKNYEAMNDSIDSVTDYLARSGNRSIKIRVFESY